MKKVIVSIRVSEDEANCSIKDTVQINSKHEVFKLPITATIVGAEEFDELNRKEMEQTGKSIQNSRVRERLMNKIAEANAGGPQQVILTSLPQKFNEEKSEFNDMWVNLIACLKT